MLGRKFIFSYFWPVMCGLLIAIIIVLAMPEQLGISSESLETSIESNSNISEPRLGPISYSDAVNRASPSVVSIYARVPVPRSDNALFDDPFLRQFFNADNTQEQYDVKSGAGVIVSEEGYILTNRHLIEGADQIGLVFADGGQSEATVLNVDPETDLAVLTTEVDGLQAISLGDVGSVEVGDVVLAIGNPFGRGQTVTHGIVSATGRNLLDLSQFVNFLQTDAAINEGNSGGALIDVYGNLIGINTASINTGGAQGISFSIPADMAIDIVKQIVEEGAVVRGWIGISAGELGPQQREGLNITEEAALVVTEVDPRGPAQLAGLEYGDIIVNLNGQPIVNVLQAQEIIIGTKPNELLRVGFYRNNRRIDIQIRAAARPSA